MRDGRRGFAPAWVEEQLQIYIKAIGPRVEGRHKKKLSHARETARTHTHTKKHIYAT